MVAAAPNLYIDSSLVPSEQKHSVQTKLFIAILLPIPRIKRDSLLKKIDFPAASSIDEPLGTFLNLLFTPNIDADRWTF